MQIYWKIQIGCARLPYLFSINGNKKIIPINQYFIYFIQVVFVASE
jgi:hypothetical protein